MKNKYIAPSLLLSAISLIGLGGAFSVASADTDDSTPRWERFAERFGLNKDEVRTYVEEERANYFEEKKQLMNDRLSVYVAEGRITEEQKNMIIAKQDEMRAEHSSWIDLSPQERRDKQKEHREEFSQWAQDNGIDIPLGLGGGHGFGGVHGRK
ncbi:MAG: hypothetical protein KC736_02795 [Candidatus Moranbacteria bacterium]|nr:hypothetical protein [Candidatus Moranbacteria bacterium]